VRPHENSELTGINPPQMRLVYENNAGKANVFKVFCAAFVYFRAFVRAYICDDVAVYEQSGATRN
jgi:hypothetical protein